ncbi:MAG: hypothetical protein JO276_07195 [Sphingomonadaceae bacterium]|nr:hypothetical protein [Sphingomonadaceae bacterium]
MSTIPNSAMPHAGPVAETDEGGETLTMAQRAADLAETARDKAGRLVELAKENPKTAIAGAAIAAAAAAAIPLVRAKRRSAANGASAPKSDSAKAPARKRSTTRKSPAKKS